jgi:hypothetical protein
VPDRDRLHRRALLHRQTVISDALRIRIALAATLSLLATIVFAGPLVGGDTFVLRDHVSYVLPSRAYLSVAIHEGRLPEWWGALGLGAPYAANPNHGVFYPPAWIAGLMNPQVAADVILLLHFILAGLGGAAFARRLGADDLGAAVAGAGLMLSGYAASLPPLCLALLTFAWTPWIAWGADRVARAPTVGTRLVRAVELSALFAMQILSGDPAGVLDSCLVVAIVVVARGRGGADPTPFVVRLWGVVRTGLLTVGALGLAIALAAPMVLSSVGLLGDSERAGGFAYSYSSLWSLHPLRLLELVWPRVMGDPTQPLRDLSPILYGHGLEVIPERWTVSVHIGAAMLLFSVVGATRRLAGVRVLGGGALLLVVLSLGSHTPIHKLFHALVPIAKYLRYPEKHMAGATVLLAALAGVGFTAALREGSRRVALTAISLGTVFTGLGIAYYAARHPFSRASASAFGAPEPAAQYIDYGVGQAAVAGLTAAACLVILGLLLLSRRPRMWPALAAAVVILPPVIHATQLQCLEDRGRYRAEPELLDGKPAEVGPPPPLALHRVWRHDKSFARGWTSQEIVNNAYESLVSNMAHPWGLSHVPGYDPALPRRTSNLFDTMDSRPETVEPMLDRFDIVYRVLPPNVADERQIAKLAVTSDEQQSLTVNLEGRRPRAFVAPRWRPAADDTEAMEAVLTSEDPGEVILTGSDAIGGNEGELTPCTISGPRPEEVTLACDSPSGGYAVLLDAWAEGWTATVDGTPSPVLLADNVVRAVEVGPGPHEIRLVYRTPGLRTGLAIAGVAWLAWLAVVFGSRYIGRRGRREQ